MHPVAAVAALALYAVGYVLLWRGHTRGKPSATTLWLAAAALACHGTATYALMVTDTGVNLSLINVANVVALVMGAVVAISNFRLPVENLFLLLFPVSMLALLAALLVEPGSSRDTSITPSLLLHILTSLAAYSALMMAACQSILLVVLERQLRRPTRPASPWLPPLETMEELLVAMLWIGLILLTAAILSGFLFLEDMFAQQVAHHIVITSLSWIAYALFLGGRYLFGWRGLTTVRWTLVGFALLVVGYLGSKFVLEYLLQR